MSIIRTFIAIPLPAALQQKIHDKIQPLRSRLERGLIRWVKAENIHITLKFLGDTRTEELEKLKGLLAKEVVEFAPFQLSVRKLGVFPNLSRPNTIWMGIAENEKLFTLQKRIQAVASQIGNVPEKRRFSAHLTLGRVSRKGYSKQARLQIRKAIEESPQYDFGRVDVDSVHLIESILTPKGAKYRSLFEAKLGDFFE